MVLQNIHTKMGRKRKEREESEEEIDYKTDMEEDIEEVEVKRRRIAKDGYVQYRCSMVAILKIVMVKKTIVSTERMKLLQSTPFGKMIAAFQNGTIEEQYVKKSDHALTLILQAYDVKTDTFTFCGKKFRISTKDVCQILGLPKGGALLPMPKKGAYHSAFIDYYFPGLHRIKKSDVEKALNRAVAKDCQGKEAVEEKDKDVVRLILLILFITILFPNAGSSLSWDLVKHCDDLEQIGEYGWAKPVENFLRKSIQALKKGTKNEQGSHSMGGCAVLILVSIKLK